MEMMKLLAIYTERVNFVMSLYTTDGANRIDLAEFQHRMGETHAVVLTIKEQSGKLTEEQEKAFESILVCTSHALNL